MFVAIIQYTICLPHSSHFSGFFHHLGEFAEVLTSPTSFFLALCISLSNFKHYIVCKRILLTDIWFDWLAELILRSRLLMS